MKIAILTNVYPPDGKGGAERIAWLQAEGLAQRGHEVRVWAPTTDESRGTPTACPNCAPSACPESSSEASTPCPRNPAPEVTRFRSGFDRLWGMGAFRRLFFHLRDLCARRGVARAIIEWKPDVLITHNLTGCGQGTGRRVRRARLSGRRAGIRWIHLLHDVQLAEPSGQIQQSNRRTIKQLFLRVWRCIWSLLRRMAFGVPDVLMSPSRWLLDWHRAYGFWGKTEIVLSNPVALGEARERTRYRPSTVAYVGRLAGEKGFADVLEAIPKLDLATVGSVVLVGDGPLWKKISLLNDSRVEACGPVEPEEARAVIADADLLLAPSHLLENQPTVILEAMAEGTPVIATDVGGVQELLEGTGAGVLPIADNFGACLAKEAKAILDDAKRWEAVSLAVRARAAERHDPNRYLEALERLFV